MLIIEEVHNIHTGVLKYVKPLSKYLKNVKLVYTCHSLPSRYFGNGQEQEFDAAKVLITRNKLQLIAISKGMAKELDSLFGISNTIFIPNGIEIERFENVKESKDNLRIKNGIPVSAFVLGQVGRFEDSKNHLFSIDVFREIAKKRNDAFFLIVGAGKNEGLIHERLHQYCLDKQYIILSHRKDIPELLKTMDAFIFPSKYEGLGIAVIESQIAGIRSVVSDAVPKDAFITPIAIPMSLNCSPKEWANVILDDSILNSEYGNKEDYNMKNVINKLEEVYLSDGLGTTINH